MYPMIGLSFWGMDTFPSLNTPITNINYCEINNGVFDELHIRERTDVDTSNQRDTWKIDTRILALFQGNLEAGSLVNNGLDIQYFKVKRRGINDINDITIGTINNDSETIEYTDYTQPNDDLIYSIVPVSENGLDGVPNSVNIKSTFCGYFVVDKDTNQIIAFDKVMSSGDQTVDSQFNQTRIQIDTFSKLPNIYYLPQEYHSFSLSGAFIPEPGQRSVKEYEKLLNLVKQHKPLLVKGSDGSLFVMDISNVRRNVIQNSYENHDYTIISVDCVEVEDYFSYMSE